MIEKVRRTAAVLLSAWIGLAPAPALADPPGPPAPPVPTPAQQHERCQGDLGAGYGACRQNLLRSHPTGCEGDNAWVCRIGNVQGLDHAGFQRIQELLTGTDSRTRQPNIVRLGEGVTPGSDRRCQQRVCMTQDGQFHVPQIPGQPAQPPTNDPREAFNRFEAWRQHMAQRPPAVRRRGPGGPRGPGAPRRVGPRAGAPRVRAPHRAPPALRRARSDVNRRLGRNSRISGALRARLAAHVAGIRNPLARRIFLLKIRRYRNNPVKLAELLQPRR